MSTAEDRTGATPPTLRFRDSSGPQLEYDLDSDSAASYFGQRARRGNVPGMTNHLQALALHVDEPGPGRFEWLLMENAADSTAWSKHSASQESYSRWVDALEAGVKALKMLAPDLAIGPRVTGEDPDADPVG